MKWASLDLEDLWRKLYMESVNSPSAETDKWTAEKAADEASRRASASATDNADRRDLLRQIVEDINGNRETEDSIIIRDKTVETIGDEHDCSPFASSAYGHDTMFLWTVVTLSERFCHLYNAVNHPVLYYEEMVRNECMAFEGGLENYKKLCDCIKSELEVFLTGAGSRSAAFACRDCTR
ncbi:hypothetical protein Pcinc_011773 [Petrolisthes cinctipes]|uniref:Uncharacterized protein n=1 Tax=Petrolisthes cinctipes TaxID=88211 RepID=A0AAE1G062_PETCI|nr:hypothetical protein Pcinc_011773 [Petrolisthes cinctipes]